MAKNETTRSALKFVKPGIHIKDDPNRNGKSTNIVFTFIQESKNKKPASKQGEAAQ